VVLLLRQLERLHIRIWLDEFGVHAEPGRAVPDELRSELRRLKPEITDHLTRGGEEVVNDPQERAHAGLSSPPSTPEDAAKQRAEADHAREANRRRYQGGDVVVGGSLSFGLYMRQLRRLREEREAAERGELPSAGRYATNFDVFK
jgi:hypothetical protein